MSLRLCIKAITECRAGVCSIDSYSSRSKTAPRSVPARTTRSSRPCWRCWRTMGSRHNTWTRAVIHLSILLHDGSAPALHGGRQSLRDAGEQGLCVPPTAMRCVPRCRGGSVLVRRAQGAHARLRAPDGVLEGVPSSVHAALSSQFLPRAQPTTRIVRGVMLLRHTVPFARHKPRRGP
jgi:hypothetical protein